MDDFEYQLRAEQEEREGKRKEEAVTKTYVDPNDGTVYEWDTERNGWFPKVCQLHLQWNISTNVLFTVIDRQRLSSSISSILWLPNCTTSQ